MKISAIFPAGVTDITVNGLHQWDYGRELEITADGLPAALEVHFACSGMKEAIVRVCTTLSGSAKVVIPDACLEQAGPVTAWVYVISETTGATTLTVTLPVIPRTKPQTEPTDPETYADKYTEAIAAFIAAADDVKDNLENGDIVAHQAKRLWSGDCLTVPNTANGYATFGQTLEHGIYLIAWSAIDAGGEKYRSSAVFALDGSRVSIGWGTERQPGSTFYLSISRTQLTSYYYTDTGSVEYCDLRDIQIKRLI